MAMQNKERYSNPERLEIIFKTIFEYSQVCSHNF